jgi:SAM-dependent methyltransferase
MLKLEQSVVFSDKWPTAVHERLLSVTKEDQIQKAKGVLELIIDEELEGANFLDYSGFTNCISRQYGARSDPEPFDVVLLYDVIDHVKNPFEVIDKVKQSLSPHGKLFVRCHPWLARNADHSKSNKAYVHLFYKSEIIHNKVNYDHIFKGFEINYKREVRHYLEPFFVHGAGKDIMFQKIGMLPQNIQYIDYKLSLK